MPRDLATMPAASRRMVLAAYAVAQLPEDSAERQAVWARLKDEAWAPRADDCPVAWGRVQAWFDGLETIRVPFVDGGGSSRHTQYGE